MKLVNLLCELMHFYEENANSKLFPYTAPSQPGWGGGPGQTLVRVLVLMEYLHACIVVRCIYWYMHYAHTRDVNRAEMSGQARKLILFGRPRKKCNKKFVQWIKNITVLKII